MLNNLLLLLTDITEREDANVLDAINIAWKGYLALFVAMAFIWLTIVVLNNISKKKNK